MTRKVLVFFVVFCALAIMAYAQTSPAAPTSSMPAPALKAVNGFPQGFVIEMQNFLNMVWPVVLQVTTPAASTPAIIQIQPDTTICPGSWCSGTGTISAPTTENTATPFIMGDGIDFTHELMLQLLSVGEVNDIGRAEGIANGESELLYRLLVQQHPELFPAGAKPYATSAAGADMLANQRPTVFGGAGVLQNGTLVSDFYSNIGNGQYRVIASLLSVVIEKMGGDYRQLTADIDRYQPQTRADFLAMLDQVCPLVDGVKPSTFMKQDITNFPAAPTGVYFGMAPGGGYDANYPWFLADNWPFNLTDYSQVVAEYNSATIGVLGQNYPVFQNTATAPNPEPMMWTMYDASGTQVAATQSLDAREIINPSTQVMNSILFYDWSTNQDFYTFLPEGTYLTTACLGDSSCAADPRQNDDAFEVFLGGDELSPCSIAVVGNGPAWNELGTSLVPTLISPLSASFDQHGALWNYVDIPQNPDGSCEDVTVKAGPYVRTFTPSRYEPREVNFTKRQEPTFGAPTPANPSPLVRATDFQSPPVIVPEAIYSLFGWYFTWNDPWWPSGFPIPVEGSGGTPTNDQGRTEVVFTLADGTQFKSPILYVGGYNPVTLQDQINFQAPLGLWGHVGEAATVRVAVSGVLSFQSVLVVVGASDPSGFMYTDGQGHQQGIYTFANYQLVTSGNPAHAGDVLIWWGTGLGKKQITPSQDGMPVMTADPTIGPVMVTVDGQAAKVLYAGSAPGILGLEQIDFQVPAGVTEGTQAVVVTAAQTAAQTTTYLPIAAAN